MGGTRGAQPADSPPLPPPFPPVAGGARGPGGGGLPLDSFIVPAPQHARPSPTFEQPGRAGPARTPRCITQLLPTHVTPIVSYRLGRWGRGGAGRISGG